MTFFDFIIFVSSLVLFILWCFLDYGRKRTGKSTAAGKNQKETVRDETASATVTDGADEPKVTETTKIPTKKEGVNILILGETGVGKSTWINAIANYVKYDTLKDAIDDPQFTVLIPSRFTFIDDKGKEMKIEFGSDSNENFKDGESATQFPREYSIETENTRYHLIDTPGIGDSRGTAQDNENFENILAFLNRYNKINAVVVLLKPNSARLTIAFRFCVLELLTHLHKSLVINIIFAFTNSRGTFYRPGETLPTLKKLLEDRKIDIALSPETYFCFDNEAFRFLACQKKGVNFEEEEAELFSKSWEKSRNTTARLFSFVKSMPPHDTKKTLSLNEARNSIVAMSKPMGEAVEVIEMNLKQVKLTEKLCKLDDDAIEKFQDRLHFKGYERVITKLDYPITVCTHEKCKEYQHVGKSKERQTIYKTVCHDHCHLQGIPLETTNNDQLLRCRAMVEGNCTKCHHDYRLHMHMTYTTKIKEKTFLSDEIQEEINKITDVKGQKEALIRELQKQIKENEEERKIIYECASHFGAFLVQNALIAFNDSFSDYLDMLIKDEEAKGKGTRDEERIEKLRQDKVSYEEQKKAIIEQTSSPTESEGIREVKTKDIYEMKKQLCSLKYNGETLKNALDGSQSTRARSAQVESETVCVEVKSTSFMTSIYDGVKSAKRWVRQKITTMTTTSTPTARPPKAI